MVRGLPPAPARPTPAGGPPSVAVAEALAGGPSVLRFPPSADPFPAVLAAARLGDALVVAPSLEGARAVATRLRRAGAEVALLPGEWARAAAGGCAVVGARAAAFAPLPSLAAAVVLDEHDEAHQEEGAPTWHARDVVLERARRDGAPCVMVSPVPSLAALARGRLVTLSRHEERAGWPALEVIDLRRTDPARGLLTEPLVRWLRGERRVVVVLNRKGRATLLACAACRELARCERCGGALAAADTALDGVERLACRRCGENRPRVCGVCGATRLKVVRAGVSGMAKDLSALVGEEVAEVAGPEPEVRAEGDRWPRVVVGTEAALHRVPRADVVAFVDFDQELLAPRYRAAEEALVLLARAARLVGGRGDGGRVVVQTRVPDHEAVQAALHADPDLLVAVEQQSREAMGFPPHRAVAEVGGPAAAALIEHLDLHVGLDVIGPDDGRWLLRAGDRDEMAAALEAAGRPPGRLRVAVDPLRL
jgi:primosomal protein N' (replication factor Y)